MPWAIALVCVVLGFMLSMQFKVQQQVQLKDVTAFQRAQELVSQLEKAEKERDSLMAEAENLRAQMREMANTQTQFQGLAKQLEQAQLHAGLIALQGKGAIIEMRDTLRPLAPGENPNQGIIHDEDVLRVVNELLAGGAEAIAINEQRITARSEVRCTGPTITINGIRTAPPIIIKAIGNPDELENALMMRGGIVESLQGWGLEIKVKKELGTLTVPAYKGSLKLQYATPVSQEVSKP